MEASSASTASHCDRACSRDFSAVFQRSVTTASASSKATARFKSSRDLKSRDRAFCKTSCSACCRAARVDSAVSTDWGRVCSCSESARWRRSISADSAPCSSVARVIRCSNSSSSWTGFFPWKSASCSAFSAAIRCWSVDTAAPNTSVSSCS